MKVRESQRQRGIERERVFEKEKEREGERERTRISWAEVITRECLRKLSLSMLAHR